MPFYDSDTVNQLICTPVCLLNMQVKDFLKLGYNIIKQNMLRFNTLSFQIYFHRAYRKPTVHASNTYCQKLHFYKPKGPNAAKHTA